MKNYRTHIAAMSLCMPICWGWLTAGTSAPLIYEPFNTYPTHSNYRMAANGKIMVEDVYDLYIFGREGGVPEFVISLPNPDNRLARDRQRFWIANYAYVPMSSGSGGHYAICAVRADPIADQMVKRIFIYDEDGNFLSTAFNSLMADPLDLHFRQLIPVDGRLYANIWEAFSLDNGQVNQVWMLREVALRKGPDGFEMSFQSDPFFEKYDQPGTLSAVFKEKWLLPVSRGGEKLLIMDSLDPRIYVMQQSGQRSGEASYRQSGVWRLHLTGFQDPVDFETYRANKTKEPASRKVWYHSFSRITGFYAMPDGFLVGYESPNPAHPAFSALDGEKPGEAVSPFVLNLRRFDAEARQKSNTGLQMPGSYLLGVDGGGMVFTYQITGEEGRRVHSVQWRAVD